jgi:hypothetical protein
MVTALMFGLWIPRLGLRYALSDVDVYLVRRADGKPSGEGFAVFASAEQAQQALSKDKQKLGARWIDLFITNKMELVHRAGPAIAAVSREDSAYSGVVKMRGLPWTATVQDVMGFFTGYQLEANGVYLTNGADGRPSGEGFVLFASESEASRALEKDKQKLGERWIDLFKCVKADMYAAQSAASFPGAGAKMGGGGGAGGGFSRPSSTGMVNCVRMRGLPYRVDENDIFQFFEALRVIGIFIVRDYSGRASGEGFAEFATPEECQSALSRNRAALYERYVHVAIPNFPRLDSTTVPPSSSYGGASHIIVVLPRTFLGT